MFSLSLSFLHCLSQWQRDTTSPVFTDSLTLVHYPNTDQLIKFSVYDVSSESVSDEERIGSVLIKMDDIIMAPPTNTSEDSYNDDSTNTTDSHRLYDALTLGLGQEMLFEWLHDEEKKQKRLKGATIAIRYEATSLLPEDEEEDNRSHSIDGDSSTNADTTSSALLDSIDESNTSTSLPLPIASSSSLGPSSSIDGLDSPPISHRPTGGVGYSSFTDDETDDGHGSKRRHRHRLEYDSEYHNESRNHTADENDELDDEDEYGYRANRHRHGHGSDDESQTDGDMSARSMRRSPRTSITSAPAAAMTMTHDSHQTTTHSSGPSFGGTGLLRSQRHGGLLPKLNIT